MKSVSTENKIIWAVDAFTDDLSLHKKAAAGAKHPVWVIHPRAREEQMPSQKPKLSLVEEKGTASV